MAVLVRAPAQSAKRRRWSLSHEALNEYKEFDIKNSKVRHTKMTVWKSMVELPCTVIILFGLPCLSLQAV